MKLSRFLHAASLAVPPVLRALAMVCAQPAVAANFPTRPITLIMPFGAGNAPDTAARIIAEYL